MEEEEEDDSSVSGAKGGSAVEEDEVIVGEEDADGDSMVALTAGCEPRFPVIDELEAETGAGGEAVSDILLVLSYHP